MHTPSNTGARAARRTSATPRTPESLLTSGPTVNDLQRKLAETDYAAREARLRVWAELHTNTTYQRWKALGTFLIAADRAR